jgi:hypothetical protein
MKEFKPDAFVTINMPNASRGLPRDPLFYLHQWTRKAEATVLGRRTLKIADYNRRLVWLFKREVADGLAHYHALVRFPRGRRWRGEPTQTDIAVRCSRLRDALVEASRSTPEPYERTAIDAIRGADIDVRPYLPVHAPYLLKELWRHGSPWKTDGDLDLIPLPHLPREKHQPWLDTRRGNASSGFASPIESTDCSMP